MDAKIKADFWADVDLEDIGPEMRLVILWLKTNAMTEINGALRLPGKRFEFETGLDAAWLEKTLAALPWMFERWENWVWIKGFIEEQFGRGPKMVRNNIGKAVANSVWNLPAAIRLAVWEEYPELKDLASPSPVNGSPAKDLASPSFQLPLKPSEGLQKPSEGVRAEQSRAEQSTEGECEGEHPDLAADVLKFLGEKTGADYSRATEPMVWRVVCRLAEVKNNVAAVKKMVARQAALWGGDEKMRHFLRPSTLFDETKFHEYFACRDLPAATPNLEDRRKSLLELIERSPANAESAFFKETANDEERGNLKKWRRELGELARA